jgi:type IX secretion system PorP/SprF family membrane protein
LKTALQLTSIFWGLLIACQLHAQDPHFSQFYNAPLSMNPALTGAFDGDMRFVGNYRNQWFSVPVPYTTFAGSYDQKFYLPFLGDAYIGGGLVFNYDKAGDANLSWSQVALSASYHQPLSDEQFLSGGFSLGFGQRAFDPDLLTFDDQFNGDVFDPNMMTQQSFRQTSSGYFDLSVGANWTYQSERSRNHLKIGFGFSNLTQPNITFLDDASMQLPMLLHVHTLGILELNNEFDINGFAIWQNQSAYNEAVIGASTTYHHMPKNQNEIALTAGLAYRLDDALIAILEASYLNWHVGVSYDINTSDFAAATNGNGGPEISIRYIIARVKPPEEFKACPIF